MKIIILIIAALWSLLLLLAAMMVSGAFPFYAGSFYWFSVPFHFHASTCMLLSVMCLLRPNQDIRKIISWLLRLLPISWIFAMMQWPGGDDGPGMAWLLLVGSGSMISLVGSLLWSPFNKILANSKLGHDPC